MNLPAIMVGIASFVLAPSAAYAAQGLNNACSIVGCSPISSTAISDFAVQIANLMLYSAAGLCVLFIIYGGLLMIVSVGDDSRFQKGRNAVLFAMLGLALSLASQSLLAFVASVAVSSITSNPIVTTITNVSNLLISAFNALFVIAVIVGGYRMVLARGEQDKFNSGRQAVTFAIIGAIVVNLAKLITNYIYTLGL